jgi:plastocyanin
MKRFMLIFAMLAALPLALAAKGGASVKIKEMKFTPASVSVKVGESVTWTNEDDRDHTVTAADGSFASDNLKPGASFSFQFNKPGKYAYACSYHPRMKGVVSVSEK